MIVFLTEEASMTPVIRKMMNHLHPEGIEGYHWQVRSFQGKADLEKQLPDTVRSWNYNDPFFIVLRDNDGGDCLALKSRLDTKVCGLGKPYKIRIVCQELEGWFLGDLKAVEKAYPESNATRYHDKAKYRNPDNLNNASQLLKELTQTSGKVGRATAISEHLAFEENRSTSFQVLRKTLISL